MLIDHWKAKYESMRDDTTLVRWSNDGEGAAAGASRLEHKWGHL